MTTTPAASPTPGTNSGNASSASKDPWALATGNSYDPDTIYTRASDDHGHSALIHTKVSTTLHAEIRALVESRQIPELRTNADVIRDALIHRMVHYRNILAAMGASTGTITSTISTEIREAKLDEIGNKQAHWGRLIDKLDARLSELMQIGDYDTAWWLIDQNYDPEDMTPPFTARLNGVLAKHTAVLRTMANRLPVIEDTPYATNGDGGDVKQRRRVR